MENVDGYSHLKIRAGKYYWRQTIKGKKYFHSLHVPATGKKSDLKEAVDAMRVKQRIARSETFSPEEMNRTCSQSGFSSMGKILDCYNKAAAAYGNSPNSTAQNINAMKLVIKSARGSYSDDLPSSILTDQLVRDYRDGVLAARPKDEASQDKARRTIRSTLTQARAVFAARTYEGYKGLSLPDLTGFRRGGAVKALDKLYSPRPKALIDATIKAARKLPSEGRVDLYTVFLLAYEGGLRACEIKAATKDWLQDGYIEVRLGKQWTTHRVARKVPLNPETIAELKAAFRPGETHIVPGKNKTDRDKLVSREFSKWMRGIGWSAEEYIHTNHELRALRGATWVTELGLDIAARLLGHKSTTTCYKFYSALIELPDALPRERADPAPIK